jgi:uncharacterized protein (DUF2384 family)
MGAQLEAIAKGATLDISERFRCRWLKETLELSDREMAYILGVSVETLRNRLRDANDTHATESVRFHRLLNFTRLAKGVILPERLGHWIRHQNPALGKGQPLDLPADEAGCEMVSALLEDSRMGIPD